MSKRDIRLHYVCTKLQHELPIESIVKDEFNIIRDSKNPDYIIVGDGFLGYDNRAVKEFFGIYKNAITIFVTFESILPEFNFFDYIIARDNINFSDRYIRIFYNESITEEMVKGLSIDKAREILKSKKYFCNFIYSHQGHPTRDLIFHEVSKYKFVHSLGKHLRNCESRAERWKGDFFSSSIELKKDFKFSIAAENGIYKDGVTEKIYSSFLANTIPIYFGDTNIGSYFNKEAFINFHDYNSIDDFVARIKEIDSDDELYSEILSKPIITKEQYDSFKKEIAHSREMILSIFKRNIDDSRRKPDAAIVNMHGERILKRAVRLNCFINIEKILLTIAWLIPIRSIRDSFKKKYL